MGRLDENPLRICKHTLQPHLNNGALSPNSRERRNANPLLRRRDVAPANQTVPRLIHVKARRREQPSMDPHVDMVRPFAIDGSTTPRAESAKNARKVLDPVAWPVPGAR